MATAALMSQFVDFGSKGPNQALDDQESAETTPMKKNHKARGEPEGSERPLGNQDLKNLGKTSGESLQLLELYLHSDVDRVSWPNGKDSAVGNNFEVQSKRKSPKQKKRTWKKPIGKPKRPLSAYNIFFRAERERMMHELEIKNSAREQLAGAKSTQADGAHKRSQCKIGFAPLARSIAEKWKNIDDATKKELDVLAEEEKVRYKRELDIWMKEQNILSSSSSNFSSGRANEKRAKHDNKVQSTVKALEAPLLPMIETSPSESIASSANSETFSESKFSGWPAPATTLSGGNTGDGVISMIGAIPKTSTSYVPGLTNVMQDSQPNAPFGTTSENASSPRTSTSRYAGDENTTSKSHWPLHSQQAGQRSFSDTEALENELRVQSQIFEQMKMQHWQLQQSPSSSANFAGSFVNRAGLSMTEAENGRLHQDICAVPHSSGHRQIDSTQRNMMRQQEDLFHHMSGGTPQLLAFPSSATPLDRGFGNIPSARLDGGIKSDLYSPYSEKNHQATWTNQIIHNRPSDTSSTQMPYRSTQPDLNAGAPNQAEASEKVPSDTNEDDLECVFEFPEADANDLAMFLRDHGADEARSSLEQKDHIFPSL